MTYREYFNNNPEKNMPGCVLYVTEDGRNALLMNDSGITIRLNGIDTYSPNDDEMEAFARTVNPYYDLYKGYTSYEIALLWEIGFSGCARCPWNSQCERMNEEVEGR